MAGVETDDQMRELCRGLLSRLSRGRLTPVAPGRAALGSFALVNGGVSIALVGVAGAAPTGTAVQPSPSKRARQRGRDSMIRLSWSRSLRLARRIAAVIAGAVTAAKPDGVPRLRRVISVPPSPVSCQV
jgi:hypothetical protein